MTWDMDAFNTIATIFMVATTGAFALILALLFRKAGRGRRHWKGSGH